jgi:hypothetical protein
VDFVTRLGWIAKNYILVVEFAKHIKAFTKLEAIQLPAKTLYRQSLWQPLLKY